MPKGFVIGTLAIDSDSGLMNFLAANTLNKFDCFNKLDGTNYQVPAGKKLTIVLVIGSSAAATFDLRICYGDNAKDNDAAAPTNVIFMINYLRFLTANYNYESKLWLVVPALKYPHMVAYGQDQTFNIWAIEEDV